MRSEPAASDPPAGVVRAAVADLDILSQVIADAFVDLPQSRWLIPDLAARRDILPGYFRLLTAHALENGRVWTTTDHAAVALWLPASPHAPAESAGYAARLAAATGPWVDRFRAFDATLERHHVVGVPHEHLAILAVRPGRQGRGLGTMLLRVRHAQLDCGAGTPAYLEAATWRNVRLYERHGYALTPAAPFHLPGGGPPMWPMIRPAIAPAGQPGSAPRQEQEAAGP